MKSSSNRPESYAKLTYIQKAAQINRKLRTGDVTRIAEATGFSPSYTSQVLSGQYFNDSLLNKAYDMVRGRITNARKLDTVLG
jgi:hypothetical protein